MGKAESGTNWGIRYLDVGMEGGEEEGGREACEYDRALNVKKRAAALLPFPASDLPALCVTYSAFTRMSMPTFLPPPCHVSTPPLPPFSCRCACSSIISWALDGSTGAVAGAVASLMVAAAAVAAAGSTSTETGSEASAGVVMVVVLAVCVLACALWVCAVCEKCGNACGYQHLRHRSPMERCSRCGKLKPVPPCPHLTSISGGQAYTQGQYLYDGRGGLFIASAWRSGSRFWSRKMALLTSPPWWYVPHFPRWKAIITVV